MSIIGQSGIDLLHHGDTGRGRYLGQLDEPLTAHGWTQLRAAIFGRAWESIVTSPMRRCADFACELASARRVPVRVDPRLADYHYGEWQGKTHEAVVEEYGPALSRWLSDPVHCPPPGAESFASFRERLCGALNQIAEEAVSRRVLVVTHGGVVRMLRFEAEGRDITELMTMVVPPASLYTINWQPPG